MASLSELGLKNDAIGDAVDFDNLPKTGGFAPLVPPGRYRFQLPKNLGNVWDKVAATVGERITAIFDQNAPLLILQSPGKAHDGEPFQTRISNVERPRGKEKILVSDLDYVLRSVGNKTKVRRGDNKGYINALLPFGSAEFPATVEWQWSCNPKRNIYVDDGQGGSQEVPDKPGCGARYYQKDVEKVNGVYPERITCGGEGCGASLRAFAQLSDIG